MAFRQKIRQKIFYFFSWLLRVTWQALAACTVWVVSRTQNILAFFAQRLNKARKYLAQKKLAFFVLFLLITFSVFSFSAIVPSTHIFEGNLIVEELSFTYNGNESGLFINTVKSIQRLKIEGTQENLTFPGKLQSPSFLELNKLKKTLRIDLNSKKSKLIIEPASLKSLSMIDLKELRLQPNTKVSDLTYDFYRARLAFSLQASSEFKAKTQSSQLKLNLGEKPLKVTLEGYKAYEFHQKNSLEELPLEFIFTPDNKEFILPIKQNNNISITIAKPNNKDPYRWFQKKIDTKDVKFERLEKTGIDIHDNLTVSTIVEGKIRMAEQEREIKANQFLMGEKSDVPLEVQRIRHLQIVPKKGLEVRISGRTKQIQIGLNKDFPISRIQGSWLDGLVPRDAIIALFTFSAATLTYLLGFLIENISKSNSP